MMASAKTEKVAGVAGPLGKSEVEAQTLAN
jgi:hypothetical protein